MIILRTSRPIQPAVPILNLALPGVTACWVGSRPYHEIVSGTPLAVPLTNHTPTIDSIGYVAKQTTAAAGFSLVSNSNRLFPDLTSGTVAVLFRHLDTTARSSFLFGYAPGTTDRVSAHVPYSDGNVYWDFGNGNAGNGRVSAAWGTKTTGWQRVVFVAGGGRGREIWRNGSLLVANTLATSSRPVNTAAFAIGGNSTVGNDNNAIALIVVSSVAWPRSVIKNWFTNPWGATFAPRTIALSVSVTSSYTHPTLSAATALETGATSFKPSVTYQF